MDNLEICKLILSSSKERGLPESSVLEMIDKNGYTSLYYAASMGRYDIMEFLIDNGADYSKIKFESDGMKNFFNKIEKKKLLETNKKLQEKIERMGQRLKHLWDRPGGPGFSRAKNSFDGLINSEVDLLIQAWLSGEEIEGTSDEILLLIENGEKDVN